MKSLFSVLALIALIFSPVTYASLINFGSASNYTIASAGASHWQGNLLLGSEAHIFGSVAASGTMEIGDGVIVEGSACAKVANNWGGIIKGESGHCTDFANLTNDIIQASNQAQNLDGMQLGNINSNTTVTTGMGSIFSLESLVLGGGESLTLVGKENDKFLFNVFGEAKLGSGASILLGGSLKAENVVFNFVANPIAHTFEIGGANISGTYLSNGRSFILGDGATLNNTRFYSTESIVANVQDVKYVTSFLDSSKPVNTPSTLSVFLLGALLVLFGLRKRT